MIRSFGAGNFWSIKKFQRIDLVVDKHATDSSRHFRMIKDGDRVPTVVAVYGHNASGKTSLLKIPRFLSDFISRSFHYEANVDIAVQPFLSSDSEDKPSDLEISFDLSDEKEWVTYFYEVSLTKKRVIREALYYTPRRKRRLLFERHAADGSSPILKTGPDFQVDTSDPMRTKITEKASVISTFSQFNHAPSIRISRAATAVFSNVFSFGRGEYPSEQIASSIFKTNSDAIGDAKAFLRYGDLGIDDFIIEEQKIFDKTAADQQKTILATFFIHKGLTRPLSYWEESHGTQALYRFLPFMLGPLKLGGTAILDELDADIHPMMLPKIIDMYHSTKSNDKNAQLILSGHNPYTLSFLEKEEVYFTEKDDQGRTSIFGLRDIKGVRRVDNYFLKYLGGVYGGVPR